MKVISFSLWGGSPVYNRGAIRNAELALDLYPGWECWFHCSRCVPEATLAALRRFQNSKVILMDEDGSHRGLFWRFFPASDPSVEVMLSRDCDSRIEYREVMAVRDFMQSDKGFHVMRDHPFHNVPILGGMFGVKHPLLAEMNELLEQAPEYRQPDTRLGSDQDFLARVVWPRVKDKSLTHDGVHSPGPWPMPKAGLRFVGQAFDSEDRPLYPKHHEHLPRQCSPDFRMDLRDLPLFVVSGNRFRERQESIRKWAGNAGLRRPVFFQDEFGGKNRSNIQNHLSALGSAPIPFLVLEDDARVTGNYTATLEIPCGASAVYLGTSSYGLTPSGARDGAVLTMGAPGMPRILNMLSLHAVLYLDASYVAAIRSLLLDWVWHADPPPSDVLIAGQMAAWNVCALSPPHFYQNDGTNEYCTKQPLAVWGMA